MPLVPLLLWSVTEKWFYPASLPQQFGLRAWRYILDIAGKQILTGLWDSCTIAFAATALSLLIGLPAGRALGLYRFRGKKLIALMLMLPVIVPPLSVSMGLHFWFIRLGIAETFFGVVLIHVTFCLPYAVFVLWGVFADYNSEIEEQARTLGASRPRTFFQVTLPMILPGVTVAALFSFLLSWSQYLSTLIIGGGKMLTLPILLFSLMDSGDRPVASAVSLVFILPALLALAASTRSISRQGTARSQMMGSLRLDNLCIGYGGQTIVSNLSIEVGDKEITSLLGPSGAGKTTVLKTIAGLLKPRAGKIFIDGTNVNHLPAEHRNVVLIFQKPLLFPFLDVAGNIGFGLKMAGITGREARMKIDEMLDITGLGGLGGRKIHQLSGGQQQRVALARGLVLKPSILLLDEPLSNLDAELRQQMRELLLTVHAQTGTTMLFVTHDQGEAMMLSDRIFLLLDGALRQSGNPGELFYQPQDEDVAQFFGCSNILHGHIENHLFHSGTLTIPAHRPDSANVTAVIRPEHIELATEPARGSRKGRVMKTSFEGTVTQVVVDVEGRTFTVLAIRPDISAGQVVHVTFPPKRLHYLTGS